MSQENRVWQLVRGNELLAGLVVTGGDFPWLNAQVRPAAGFAEVQPLFEDELRQLDHLDEDPAPWQAAYDRIRQAVRLLAPGGRPVAEFLLHIDGTTPGGDGAMSPSPSRAPDCNTPGIALIAAVRAYPSGRASGNAGRCQARVRASPRRRATQLRAGVTCDEPLVPLRERITQLVGPT